MALLGPTSPLGVCCCLPADPLPPPHLGPHHAQKPEERVSVSWHWTEIQWVRH